MAPGSGRQIGKDAMLQEPALILSSTTSPFAAYPPALGGVSESHGTANAGSRQEQPQ